jgi:hypothetical protein
MRRSRSTAGSAILVAAAPGAVALTMAAFVRLHDETVPARRHGADSERYRSTVPAWIPRRRTRRIDDPQEFA